MLQVSQGFHTAFKSEMRNQNIKTEITHGTTVYTSEHVNTLKYEAMSFVGDSFSIGSAPSNGVNIVFSEIITTFKEMDEIKVRMGITVNGTTEWVPLGTFYLSERADVDYNEKRTTIECLDGMVFMEGLYKSKLSYPASIKDVALEIANLAGMAVNTTSFTRLSTQPIKKIVGLTYRQAIGVIAQFETGYATFDRNGKLDIRTLSNAGYVVNPEEYFLKGLKKNDLKYTLGGISVKVDDDITLTAGQAAGAQIELENSIMTQQLLDGIYTKLKTTNFYPFSLSWRGNPAVEAGDWIEMTDVNGNVFKGPIFNYQLLFDGGLRAESSANVEVQSSSTTAYKSPLSQKLEQIGEAIKGASGNLNYYGLEAPVEPKEGDIWFKPNGPDEELWQYVEIGGVLDWKLIISTADISKIEKEIVAIIAKAEKDKQESIAMINAAIAESDRLVKEQAIKFTANLNAQKAQLETKITTSRDQAVATAQAGITALETAQNTRMDGMKVEAEGIKATADKTRAEVDLAVANAGFTNLNDTIFSLDTITKSTKEDVNKATADAKLALENYKKIDKRNLYLESTEHEGVVITKDGLFEPNDFYNTSDYIRVYQGETYTFYDYSDALDIFRVATYDAYTSEFIERVAVPSKDGTFVIPNGISHIRVSISSQGVAKIERGETRSDYTQAPEDVQVSITNIKGELVQKVSQNIFDVVQRTVETHNTSISQNKSNILLKANQTYVDTIKDDVTANRTSIGVNASQILLKASQSSVDTLTGITNGNTSEIEVNAREIRSKVSSLDVENILTGKQYVNQSQLTQTSSGILASVTQLRSKVDTLETRNLYVDSLQSVGKVLTPTGTTEENSYFSTSYFIKVYEGETYTFHTHTGSLEEFRVSQYDLTNYTDFKRRVLVAANDGKLTIPSDVTHIRVSKQAGSRVKIERSETKSDWTPAPEDVTTLDKYSSLEIKVDGIQTSVGNKAEQSQVTQLANAIESRVTSEQMESRITQTANVLSLRVSSLDKRNLYINATETENYVLNADGTLTNLSGFSTSHYIRVYVGQTVSLKDHGGALDAFRIGLYDLSVSTNFNKRIIVSKSVGKFVVPEGVTHIRVTRATGSKIKIELNDTWTEWTPAPEDVPDDKEVSSKISLLSKSINLKVSKGEVSSQINIEAERTLISSGKLILDANTYIMGTTFANDIKAKSIEAVNANIGDLRTKLLTADVITSTHLKVDSALITKLKVSNLLANNLISDTIITDAMKANALTAITANITSIRSQVLVSNVVEATHLKADTAMINKLFATTALIDTLTSKVAFINSIKAIDISADRITAGTLNAANVRFINMDGSSLTTGTINAGNNSSWDLRTGLFQTTDAYSNMRIENGGIKFYERRTGALIGGFQTNYYSSSNTTQFDFFTGDRVGVGLRFEGNTIQTTNRFNPGNIYLIPSQTGKVLIKSTGGSHFGVEAASYSLNGYSELYETSDNSLEIYSPATITMRQGGGTYVFNADASRFKLQRDLNMSGFQIYGQSDRRLKTDIRMTDIDGLGLVRKYTYVNYRWKDKDAPSGVHLGLIAQDTPYISSRDKNGVWNISLSKQTMVHGVAIQQLDKLLSVQDEKIEMVKATMTRIDTYVTQHELEIKNLKKRINELEEKVA